MKTPPSPARYSYVSFRRRLARKALVQFVASVVNSLEIVLLAFGPVMLGLVACIALPGLLAPTLPWCEAVGLLLAQTLLVAAPVWLLRQRLHPADVARWSRALPVSARDQWRAEASVAGLIVGPMALAHAVSCAIWWYQWPEWLRPVAPVALACALLSLLLGWALATLLLMRRARPAPARAGAGRVIGRLSGAPGGVSAAASAAAASAASASASAAADADASGVPAGVPAVADTAVSSATYSALPYFALSAAPAVAAYLAPPAARLPAFTYWRQLFWLPCWRGDSTVGIQQTCLFIGALLSLALWLLRPTLMAWMPPAVWGAGTAMLLVLLTDRGDKAVAEQIARLRPAVANWPLSMERLFSSAMVLTLLPGVMVMACFAALALAAGADVAAATGLAVDANIGSVVGVGVAAVSDGVNHRHSLGLSHTVALVWLACAGVAQLAIVGLRTLTARGRVALVMGAILILTAIGSELWH